MHCLTSASSNEDTALLGCENYTFSHVNVIVLIFSSSVVKSVFFLEVVENFI